MYYPFLRGKQEELLALQELVREKKLSNKIIPLIEPVKLSSTLVNTLQMFCDNGIPLYLVVNPIVGQFEDDLSTALIGDETEDEKRQIERLIANKQKYNEQVSSDNIHFALYYGNDFTTYFEQDAIKNKGNIILLFTKDDSPSDFVNSDYFGNDKIALSFVPSVEDADGFENYSVLFRDRFNKASKNADYPEDEFFSKDHLIFSKYGCVGFSDYSIVGEKFEDAGFTPRAIAIHIVYPTSKNVLNIKHFLSDSNTDAKNPAGKFSEAARKLVVWSKENPDITSLGLKRLIQCYESQPQRYPGLGSLKRYSIMHHLEIIGKLI